MCVIYCLFFVFSGLSHVFSLLYEFLINALDIFSNIHKSKSVLRKYFIARYEFPSVHTIKKKNLDVPPGISPCTIQTNLRFISAIMPQVIVIFHCPPIHAMIRNKFRIIEFNYPPFIIFIYYFWPSGTVKPENIYIIIIL